MVIHQNRTSIKLRNEEKVKQMTIAHISETRQDIKISSTYLESAANFTSDRCDSLKGVLGAIRKKLHFSAHLQHLKRVLGIHRFDQESVHRCNLGCSTYLDVDF